MSEYNNYNQQDEGRELGWEDEINDEFVELAPGKYSFTVSKLARGRHSGTDWMPACNKVDLELSITDPATGVVFNVKDTLHLHTKGKWKICKFFEAIGLKKKGDPLKMSWNIIGKTGWCETVLKEGSRGGKFVNISKYLPAEDMTAQPATSAPQAPASPTWTPGAF